MKRSLTARVLHSHTWKLFDQTRLGRAPAKASRVIYVFKFLLFCYHYQTAEAINKQQKKRREIRRANENDQRERAASECRPNAICLLICLCVDVCGFWPLNRDFRLEFGGPCRKASGCDGRTAYVSRENLAGKDWKLAALVGGHIGVVKPFNRSNLSEAVRRNPQESERIQSSKRSQNESKEL